MTVGLREEELLFSASAASSQKAKATAEMRQTHDTIGTRSKELMNISQLKTSIKGLKDSESFYEASEESLNGNLEAVEMESARTC